MSKNEQYPQHVTQAGKAVDGRPKRKPEPVPPETVVVENERWPVRDTNDSPPYGLPSLRNTWLFGWMFRKWKEPESTFRFKPYERVVIRRDGEFIPTEILDAFLVRSRPCYLTKHDDRIVPEHCVSPDPSHVVKELTFTYDQVEKILCEHKFGMYIPASIAKILEIEIKGESND